MTAATAEPGPSFVHGWINTYGMFDPAVPFGGRKHSGFGRELGEEALEPYLQPKSIWLDLEAAVPQSGQGISR